MLWIIAAFLAFFIKGLCGFANTLVFSSILSFGMNNINISPVDLLLGYFPNIIIAYKERKHIQWKLCLYLILLILIGSVPGIYLLKNTDTTIIKILFGFVIIGIGMQMFLQRNSNNKPSRLFLLIIGFTSGLLCGLFGIGALLSAYLSRTTKDTHEFKANMCTVFTTENTVRILLYVFYGIINLTVLKTVLLLIPIMFLGLFIGMKTSKTLNEKTINNLVIIMLIISGILLVLKNI